MRVRRGMWLRPAPPSAEAHKGPSVRGAARGAPRRRLRSPGLSGQAGDAVVFVPLSPPPRAYVRGREGGAGTPARGGPGREERAGARGASRACQQRPPGCCVARFSPPSSSPGASAAGLIPPTAWWSHAPRDSGIRGITGSPFGGVRLRPWARASLPAAPRGRRVKKTKETKASCGRAVRTGKRGLRAGGLEAALRPSHPLCKIPSLKPGSGHE